MRTCSAVRLVLLGRLELLYKHVIFRLQNIDYADFLSRRIGLLVPPRGQIRGRWESVWSHSRLTCRMTATTGSTMLVQTFEKGVKTSQSVQFRALEFTGRRTL